MILQVCNNYNEEWTRPAPCTCQDGMSGTLLILENKVVCMSCGDVATQRMSYVWNGTKRKDLKEMPLGSSVKHYFTHCDVCGSGSVS